ncbi:hypothetical protein [Methanonatronarchaeum sp. AMET-Sl]|uniref:hypothetical protein n=1 Tax=Methanonatronarchaeum sp. AMET-Sl TaxID=3037654 RepID=UPI00244E4C23|nr:hypothetical protein [Methanonatronarchaeum sp. AMET-Sl]WGI17871.1 hypothetical protein QEN48_02375 [Methanonatronarchaeum sp. AMET-Sl]
MRKSFFLSLLLIFLFILGVGGSVTAVDGDRGDETGFLSDFFRLITGTTVHERYETTYLGAGYTWIMDFFSSDDDCGDGELNSVMIYDYGMQLSKDDSFIISAFGNEVGNTETFVWSLAKSELLKELNNGSSLEEAQVKTQRVIDEYYSNIEYNFLQQVNSQVMSIEHLMEVNAEIETIFQYPFEAEWYYDYSSWQDGSTQTDTRYMDLNLTKFYDRDVVLLNGSSVSVLDYEQKDVSSVPNNHGSKVFYVFPYPDNEHGVVCGGAASSRDSKILVSNPVGSDGEVMDLDIWEDVWKDLYSTHEMMKDNMEVYVHEVYQEYSDGLDLTGVVDPYVLAQHLNTLHNQTGYYGYAGAELALLGINTTINDRFIIEIHESNVLQDNSTWEGMLFTNACLENNTLETDRAYNTENYSAPFYLATDEGLFWLYETSFEILEIISFDGERLEEVELYKPIYHTINASQFEDELKQIAEIYDLVSDWSADSGDGQVDGITVGDLGDWLNRDLGGVPYWLIILGIGAFVFIRRGGSGDNDIIVRKE